MPGLDRKGPFGEGPKTGRGLGRCNPDNKDKDFTEADETGPGRGNRFRGGAGPGRGLGRGNGRGGGRGLGRGNGPGRGRGPGPGRGLGRGPGRDPGQE